MSSDIGSPQPPSQPAAAPEARTNSFSRIAGALFSPNETFAEIARKPDFLIPLIVLVIVGFVTTVLLVPRMDFESATREAMERQSQNMSSEDMERALRIGTAFGKAITYVSPVLGIIVLMIIAGVLLLAFRLFGGEGTFKQAFSVTLYAWFPMLISGILMTVIALTRTAIPADQVNALLKSNLGAFVDPKEQMVLFALLSSIDIFTIWTVALLSIGFAHLSKFSKTKSAVIVVSLWLVTVVVKVGFAALGAARMKAT
jgi:hypothetical protein